MKKKISFFLMFIVVIQILSGCSNQSDTFKKDALNVWEKGAVDGYSVYEFIGNKANPTKEQKILNLSKYKDWSGDYTYRYIENHSKIDYRKAFNEKSYPFYLIVSKTGIKLKTTSVNDVVQFFEKNGGGITATK